MATGTLRTMADLLAALAVPPERILVSPPPGTAIPADVIECNERNDRLVELVDGVLVEKAMGFEESLVAQRISFFLMQIVQPRQLGVVAGSDGMIRIAGQVRMPDVAYFSWDRFPDRKLSGEAIPAIVS